VDDLPPQNIRRWMPSRKAAVVAAVRDNRITVADALHRYQLTAEEFCSWQRAFERHGLAGLRATRIQQYRETRLLQRSRKLRSRYDPASSPSNPQCE
jgi:transposase-like protein